MIGLALATVLLVGGCLSPRTYVCETNEDCTGGEGGRCETEGVCSFLDPICDSGRRFGDFSGSLSAACTHDRPLNACVAGEPWPEIDGDACARTVCEQLPSCCTAMWSEACVHAADRVCADVHCGAWLATGGPNGTRVLEWTGTQYKQRASQPGQNALVTWVDGRERQPRLAVGMVSTVSEYVLDLTATNPSFTSLWSYTHPGGATVKQMAAADTDGNEVVELGLAFAGVAPHVVVLNESGVAGAMVADLQGAATGIGWADWSGDGIPDFAIATPAGYRLYYWSTETARFESQQQQGIMGSGFQSIDWDDFNGDGRLDLTAIGGFAALHLALDGSHLSVMTSAFHRPPQGGGPGVGAAGDLDGDGKAEALIANAPDGSGRHQFGVLHYDAPTRDFPDPPYLVDATGPMVQLAVADVDDDGKLDVIVALEAGGLEWFKNTTTASGAYSLTGPTSITDAGSATSFAVTGWRAP